MIKPTTYITFLGDPGVGKYSYILKLANQRNLNDLNGFNQNEKLIDHKKETYFSLYDHRLVIFRMDANFCTESKTIRSIYFRKSHIILLFYDITKHASFDALDDYVNIIIEQLSSYPPIILVGTHPGVNYTRAVTQKEAQEKALSIAEKIFDKNNIKQNPSSTFKKDGHTKNIESSDEFIKLISEILEQKTSSKDNAITTIEVSTHNPLSNTTSDSKVPKNVTNEYKLDINSPKESTLKEPRSPEKDITNDLNGSLLTTMTPKNMTRGTKKCNGYCLITAMVITGQILGGCAGYYTSHSIAKGHHLKTTLIFSTIIGAVIVGCLAGLFGYLMTKTPCYTDSNENSFSFV